MKFPKREFDELEELTQEEKIEYLLNQSSLYELVIRKVFPLLLIGEKFSDEETARIMNFASFLLATSTMLKEDPKQTLEAAADLAVERQKDIRERFENGKLDIDLKEVAGILKKRGSVQ